MQSITAPVNRWQSFDKPHFNGSLLFVEFPPCNRKLGPLATKPQLTTDQYVIATYQTLD